VVGELDLDCAVVKEFGGSFAHLITFFASVPAKADRVAGVFDLKDSLERAEAISPPCAVIVSVAGPQGSR
jgi:hypothetical protein